MRPDRERFVWRYGIAAAGIPIAVIADLVFLTLGDNWPLFLTRQHLEQLVTMLLVIPPTFGAGVGYGLLRLADRRAREAELERAFRV
jgi:ABC-type molybdate transport system permease subunit